MNRFLRRVWPVLRVWRWLLSMGSFVLFLVCATTARAQTASPAALPSASDEVVETWYGEGSGSAWYARGATPWGYWDEPGDARISTSTKYYLEVDSNGQVRGTIHVSWFGSVWLPEGAKAQCNAAVAENGVAYGIDCRLGGSPSNGEFDLTVVGTRTRTAQGDVIFALEPDPISWLLRYEEVLSGTNTNLGLHWRFRRPSHIEFALAKAVVFSIMAKPSPGWNDVTLEQEINGGFNYPPISEGWQNRVWLQATGGKPLLKLDKELLERSVFMDKVSVKDGLIANLTWSAAGGGQTSWQIASANEMTPVSQETKIPRSVDVGSVGAGEHEVRVQAKDTLDRLSLAEQFMLVAGPYYERCPNYTATNEGPVAVYRCSVAIPDPAFEARIAKMPDWLPYFRGKPLGLGKVQFTAEMELRSTTDGSLKGEGGTVFEAMGNEIGGAIAVKGDLALLPDGVRFKNGNLEFALKGKVSKEETLLVAVPPLKIALDWARKFSNTAVDYLEKTAKARLEIEPKLAFALAYENSPDPKIGWQFKSATPSAGSGFKVFVKLEPVQDLVSLSGGLGGDFTFTFIVPPKSSYLKQVDIKFLAYYTLQAWKYIRTGEQTWGFSYSQPGGVVANAQAASALNDTWTLIDRSYLSAPNYSRWTAESAAAAGRILENVGPLAHPSLSQRSAVELVWSYEKPGSNALNGDELAFASLNGNAFTVLTNDDRSDWNPQMLAVNVWPLVLWQRMDVANPGDFNADPNAFLSHMQVAAARFNPSASPLQFTPVQISTSGSINHRPKLVNESNGGAIAVWVNNPANLVMGDAAHPDRLMYSVFSLSNNSWSAPQEIVGNIPGIRSFDVASYPAQTGFGLDTAILYTTDADGNPGTANDIDLFYTVFKNGAWSAVSRLTTTEADETDVRLLSSRIQSSNPRAVWRAGDKIMFLDGAWNGTPVVLYSGLPSDAGNLQFVASFVEDAFAILWTQGDSVCILRRAGTPLTWGAPKCEQPGGPEAVPVHVEGVLPGGSDAPLLIVSQVEIATPVTRTVAGIAYPNVPVVGARHVYATRMLMTRPDLSVDAVEIVDASGVQNASGQTAPAFTVRAMVRNLGASTAVSVSVRLLQSGYTGPALTLDEEKEITIPGFGSVPVTLTSALPSSGDYQLTVQAGLPPYVEESSALANNSALIPVDAALASAHTEYSPSATAVRVAVRQVGPVPHSPVLPLVVTRDTAGTVALASAGVLLPNAPTTVAYASVNISPTVLGPGRHTLYWMVDPNSPGLVDLRSANNFATSLVEVMPDLVVDPNFAQLDNGQVQFRVQNVGNWPSTQTTAEIYDAYGTGTGAPLATLTVPPLQPGQITTVVGALQQGSVTSAAPQPAAISIVLDPKNRVAELNENQNESTLGSLFGASVPPATNSQRVYLPLVKK